MSPESNNSSNLNRTATIKNEMQITRAKMGNLQSTQRRHPVVQGIGNFFAKKEEPTAGFYLSKRFVLK